MLLGNNPYPRDERVRYEALSLVAAGYRVAVIAPRAARESKRERVEGVAVHRYWNPVLPKGALGYVVEYAAATRLRIRRSRFGFSLATASTSSTRTTHRTRSCSSVGSTN